MSRDLGRFVLEGHSLITVNAIQGTHENYNFFVCVCVRVCSHRKQQAPLLICQEKLHVPMPLRPPACVLFSCKNASKWCLFCAVILKVCKEQSMKEQKLLQGFWLAFSGTLWTSNSSPSSKMSSRVGYVIKKALLK